jgi:hypothetical protein
MELASEIYGVDWNFEGASFWKTDNRQDGEQAERPDAEISN